MTLADLLAKFADVVAERDGYVVPCPAHEDGHASLHLGLSDDGKVLLYCRAGCPKADVLAALEREHGIHPRDLFDVEPGEVEVRRTSAVSGPIPPAALASVRAYVGACAEALWEDEPVAEEARAYMAERFGIDEALAKRLDLGLDRGGRSVALDWRGSPFEAVPRLVVPFSDPSTPGLYHAVQGRALREHKVRWSGLTNGDGFTWGRTAAFFTESGRETIIVTEGPSDALTVAALGYDAVAVRGAALTDGAVVEEVASVFRGRHVVIAGDADTAGARFASDLSAALMERGIPAAVLDVPAEAGDLNAWRMADPEAFGPALDAAVRNAPTPSAPSPAPAPVVQGQDFDLTDLGNAERLLEALGGPRGVRHSPEVGFFLWNGAVWEQDRFDAVRTAAQQITKDMLREGLDAAASPDAAAQERGKLLVTWAKRSQSSRAIDSMVKELSTLPHVMVDIERMDAHHHLLAFANGVVNLRDGSVRPHDPDLLQTKRVPVDYVPGARCPRWLQFLDEVFPGDPDLPGYVQRLVGYGITGQVDEQCFAVLWGHGANGKSVFTDTLTSVFEPITQTTPFSTFEERASGGIPNDLAALKGSRLVMASEGERGRSMAEAVIKRVTGSDLITARFMRKEFFSFRPTFLILLATNHKPQFRGQDEGLWRRVKLIPFERYFRPEERDHYLVQTLQDEAEGIAAWAVEGARLWYASGLQDPGSVRRATEGYRETSDALSGFFPGRLERAPGESVLGTDAYHAYIEWAEEEGLPEREKWTRRTFYGAMEERGIDRKKTMHGQTLLGLRLVDEATAPPSVGVPPEASPPHREGEQSAPSIDDVFQE